MKQLEIEAEKLYPRPGPYASMEDYSKHAAKISAYIRGREDERKVKSGWIPVAPNSMPPFDTYVLCHCRIYGKYLGIYQRIDDTAWGNWSDGKDFGVLPPLYWMPLPPGP